MLCAVRLNQYDYCIYQRQQQRNMVPQMRYAPCISTGGTKYQRYSDLCSTLLDHIDSKSPTPKGMPDPYAVPSVSMKPVQSSGRNINTLIQSFLRDNTQLSHQSTTNLQKKWNVPSCRPQQ
eukprot:TRINITY_DN1763_c0_g1_i1.p2 TRINITY_DN1763_c0_g1~~TRINITY_DN1763_c0_g1_i1.p2  ORF type:complete len:121 (+),score=19.71 TRINITY_DN1763_c0_g1_i1:447-809(+)